MSNGDDEAEASESDSDAGEDGLPVESLQERLDDVEESIEAAETEADLDVAEAELEEVEADIEATDFPEPDEEDEEEEESPAEVLESRLEDVRAALEDARGPYAEDVRDAIDDTAGTVRGTRWTVDGIVDVRVAVDEFLTVASDHLDERFEPDGDESEDLAATLDEVGTTAVETGLDPDEDADTIARLLEATDELAVSLEEAEEWSDLTVREQLEREGFYDRLTPENRKDFPPELTVVRIAEAENDPERILMAFEKLDSDFMETNCLDALRRLGAEEALEPMLQRAQRRDQAAIQVLGKIGDEQAVETLVDFVDSGNPPLQKVTLRALGEIGSEEATEQVAQALAEEGEEVRSSAARALGLIGDTRAIDPLADVLEEDESDTVRGSAAWALNQIGTERALEIAAEYADDRAYIVQTEAEKAQASTAT